MLFLQEVQNWASYKPDLAVEMLIDTYEVANMKVKTNDITGDDEFSSICWHDNMKLIIVKFSS
jgi:hypothetical protein